MNNSTQDQIAAALEQYVVEETRQDKKQYHPGYTTPEAAAQWVELDVAFSPVLMPNSLVPRRVSRLQGDKFAIFDVGYPWATLDRHRWNVEANELKEHRARFLLQRDLFFQDMVMRIRDCQAYKADSNYKLQFRHFRYYTGAAIFQTPNSVIEKEIVPLFFPEGLFIPGENHLLSQHVAQNYIYADGTIEVVRF